MVTYFTHYIIQYLNLSNASPEYIHDLNFIMTQPADIQHLTSNNARPSLWMSMILSSFLVDHTSLQMKDNSRTLGADIATYNRVRSVNW